MLLKIHSWHPNLPFKRQNHKMVKHTQTIRWQFADELFDVFDDFVGLALKGLNTRSIHLETLMNK